MLIRTLRVQVWKQKGTDLQGQPRMIRVDDERVAPVKLVFNTQHTTVRTDSAASHGAAEERTADVVVLAAPRTQAGVNDMLVINGQKVRVDKTHARYTVGGQLDHVELHASAWN